MIVKELFALLCLLLNLLNFGYGSIWRICFKFASFNEILSLYVSWIWVHLLLDVWLRLVLLFHFDLQV